MLLYTYHTRCTNRSCTHISTTQMHKSYTISTYTYTYMHKHTHTIVWNNSTTCPSLRREDISFSSTPALWCTWRNHGNIHTTSYLGGQDCLSSTQPPGNTFPTAPVLWFPGGATNMVVRPPQWVTITWGCGHSYIQCMQPQILEGTVHHSNLLG